MKKFTLIILLTCTVALTLRAVETEDLIKRHEEEYHAKQQIEKPIIQKPQLTHRRDIIALIDEDFETGMPVEWTVIDGNNDGYTWTTGTTLDLYNLHPPNFGTAYAYYSDDDAGSSAPAGTEYLISPPVRCAGAESLSLSYSWGFNAIDNPYGGSHIRFHDGSNWSTWTLLAYYLFTGNGVDTFDLNSFLPAESVQVQFTYDDPYGEYGWAFGIDNILLQAEITLQYVWNFEDGLQDWTHTNGQVFPAAWDVVSSGYTVGTFTIAPPDAGDSSFCIDGDLGGICHDTAMSPAVNNPGFTWFKWGMHFQNYDTIQTFSVIMRTYSSGVWNPWTDVWTYTADTPPRYDSVDISATVTDSVQVGFVYDQPNPTYAWFAAFDNVGLYSLSEHDVGCFAVVSPPEGRVDPDIYDVVGLIRNVGTYDETFDIVANVYNTSGMVLVFSQTTNLTLAASGDTNVSFGQITFDPETYYLTEIFTLLPLDMNPANDTSTVLSWSTISGSVMFEMDIEAICNDNQLLGVEFDGQRFYITGGSNASDPNKLYVVDTSGNLLWTIDQPGHSTGWGWRDLMWDGTYLGPDRIDTLYASVDENVDQFSINLYNGSLVYHGSFPGAQSPNRALAYKPDSGWLYTANFSSDCFKFSKSGVIIQSVPNTYTMYGAAYDEGYAFWPWQTPIESVWWHSQDDPGTGFACQISRMDPYTMDSIGMSFGFTLPSALTHAVAGGLCFDAFAFPPLYALLQGTPHDYIVGIYVISYGIKEEHDAEPCVAFGFAPAMTTVTRGRVKMDYTTPEACVVSLSIYDITGRLVRTLVHGYEEPGLKKIHWDGKDDHRRNVASGVYLLQLEAANKTDIHKIVLIR